MSLSLRGLLLVVMGCLKVNHNHNHEHNRSHQKTEKTEENEKNEKNKGNVGVKQKVLKEASQKIE